MHDQPIPGDRDFSSSRSPADQDLHDQGVALVQALALHPAYLTAADLVREITAGSADFEDTERFERAIRDLAGAGLLYERAGLVLPTRPALHFDRLLRD